MTNKRDNRFEDRERWRDNPYRSQQGEDRHEYERTRDVQYNQRNQPEHYGERRSESHRWDEPEWERQRNEEQWVPREDYSRYAGERHYGQGYPNYGEQYRDRPYS